MTFLFTNLIERFREQSLTYVTIFRDGQDTEHRDFSFERRVMIEYGESDIREIIRLNYASFHFVPKFKTQNVQNNCQVRLRRYLYISFYCFIAP